MISYFSCRLIGNMYTKKKVLAWMKSRFNITSDTRPESMQMVHIVGQTSSAKLTLVKTCAFELGMECKLCDIFCHVNDVRSLVFAQSDCFFVTVVRCESASMVTKLKDVCAEMTKIESKCVLVAITNTDVYPMSRHIHRRCLRIRTYRPNSRSCKYICDHISKTLNIGPFPYLGTMIRLSSGDVRYIIRNMEFYNQYGIYLDHNIRATATKKRLDSSNGASIDDDNVFECAEYRSFSDTPEGRKVHLGIYKTDTQQYRYPRNRRANPCMKLVSYCKSVKQVDTSGFLDILYAFREFERPIELFFSRLEDESSTKQKVVCSIPDINWNTSRYCIYEPHVFHRHTKRLRLLNRKLYDMRRFATR